MRGVIQRVMFACLAWTGPGLYRELEPHDPHLLSRMMFLTGDVLSPEARDFFEQVDCLHLIKPLRARAVRQRIQQMLTAP